LSKVVLVN